MIPYVLRSASWRGLTAVDQATGTAALPIGDVVARHARRASAAPFARPSPVASSSA